MTDTHAQVRLCLIRHAQSEANLTKQTLCGQNISCVLTPLGHEQSVLLGKRLKYQNASFDYVLCSTATRAKQTAEIVLKIMDIDFSKVILSSAFLEQSQGNWEGVSRCLCYTSDVMKQMNELHFEFIPPEGESLRMVQKRAIDFLEPYIEQAKQRSLNEKREITIVIFTHANFIRAVLQYYTQSNPRYAWIIGQANTAITEILFYQHGISLVKVNDSAHLLFPIPETSK
ncbi:hypothetical protein I4U23_027439 [Adineta vaga]|nr:hypothetical protein I4U23_027439 [Adineta vaga]